MSESHNDPKVTALGDRHDPALSALYRDAPQDRPPAELDAQILAASRAAAVVPASPLRSRWLPVAGGIAASLIVAVLVMQLLPQSVQAPADLASVESETGALRVKSFGEKEEAAPGKVMADAAAPASPDDVETARPAEEGELPAAALNKVTALSGSDAPAVRQTAADRAGERRQPSAGAFAQMESDADGVTASEADEAFAEIVRLWESGDTRVALERYREFKVLYPDFVADDAWLDVAADLAVAAKKLP